MGAIAAAVNRYGKNAVPMVVAMLKELTHRGVDAQGVATSNSALTTKSIDEIETKNLSSGVALGHNLSRILPRDHPQPVQGDGFTLVFEGRLFPPPRLGEVGKIVEELGPSPGRRISHVIGRLEGSYALVVAVSNRIIAGRDTFGTNPLYYGENDKVCALASERKGLWRLGIRNAKSFPPGHVAVFNAQGFSFRPIKTIVQPPKKMEVNMGTGAKLLRDLLLESVRKRVSDLENVAVAFSGGLDSTVIAVLAKKCGIKVQLISVSLENHHEVEFARTAAEALGLPLHLQTYSVSDVEKILPKVMWLIEEPDIVKASIAIPLYWAGENSSKMGYNVLLVGQGGDELFGGYQKYLRAYSQFGVEAVQKAMFRDVVRSHTINFQRDNQVFSFHKVELRHPFVDREVVHFSLGLPLCLKIESAEDGLRKRILRQVARDLSIPTFIANRAKKAIQYSTGVNKAIQKLAKRKSSTSQAHVEEIFREVYPTLEVQE